MSGKKWRKEGKRIGGKNGVARPDVEVTIEQPPERQLEAPLGQGEAFARAVAQARVLRLPHALVVEGPRGGGRTTIARWLAAALLCRTDPDADRPCATCRTCTQVANVMHPDFHFVDRAKTQYDVDELEKSFYVIKVDQVRALQDALTRLPVEGRARVVHIDDADLMEEEAQNALLKTLEEPGADTFLLLEVARPERLLPTVRSRVQRLRVLPLADDVVRAELQRRAPEHAAQHPRAIALARGNLGFALRACTERAVQLHDLVLAALATDKSLRPVALARAALQGAEDRRGGIEQAQLFLKLLRAELQRKLDGLAAAPAGSYPAASSEPWTTWLEHALSAEQDLELQIPAEQALGGCLLQFAR